MYQCLTVILMLLSMLSHTVLGCGWHHAHECHAGQEESCQPISPCEHSKEHAHHGHEHSTPDHHSDETTEELPLTPEEEPCQQGRCFYLVTAPAKVLEDASQVIDTLPVFDFTCAAQEHYSSIMFQVNRPVSFTAPDLRAHALNTVWLL